MLLKLARLTSPVALAASLAACGGAGIPSKSVPGAALTDTSLARQLSTPAPTSSPSGTVVWTAGNATLGKWMGASGNECGTPVNASTSFTFDLKRSGTTCGRNQANPLTSTGSTLYLQDDHTYTWTFHYMDGKPTGSGPGMGLDTGPNPEALIWQIHGLMESDTPCTSLNFVNGSYYPKSVGAGQQWAFSTCHGFVWFGKYVQGESDDWKIVATIADADISSETYGETKLYRNGVLVIDDKGPNYHHSGAHPASSWWNFGPYKWRWTASNSGSNMTEVNATINSMKLTRL